MIEKNYIILAHNKPNQLYRLIQRLDDGFSKFYIHIDLNVNIDQFKELEKNTSVHFVHDRVKCFWGDFSIVQATINCIKLIINDNRDAYTIMLSGQCYPIAGTAFINNYLANNSCVEHIHLLDAEKSWPNYKERLFKYKINLSEKKEDHILLKSIVETDFFENLRNLRKIIAHVIQKKNVFIFLNYLKTFSKKKSVVESFYGGSQWWGFSYKTLLKVDSYLKENKNYINFFRNSLIPDEIFFHTIIGQLIKNDNEIAIKNSLTYVNWERNEGKFPVVFNNLDYLELQQQLNKDRLFARKFDIDYCDSILDDLDKSILQNNLSNY